MSDYPLLLLHPPEIHDKRSNKPPAPSTLQFPGRGRQQRRLGPRLTALQRQFEARAVLLRTESTGIEPEAVVVLEILGAVDDFARAVRRVQGLEWLGEQIGTEVAPSDDFYEVNKKGHRKQKALSTRLFLVFSNQTALNEILRLWRRWQHGDALPRGFAKWRDVFNRLHDVRRWGVQDRIGETGLLDDWRACLGFAGQVRCEIELWHRQNPDRMNTAIREVEDTVVAMAGAVHTRLSLPEIAYHSLLAELPRAAVEQLLDRPETADQIELLVAETVQFIRPVGQIVTPALEQEDEGAVQIPDERPQAAAVSALLDGLPIQNHAALRNHLVIDDPDDFAADYPADRRRHGTAMASVVVHGDLSAPTPLRRHVYVRPIMRPHEWQGNSEVVPNTELVVDLVHRAVQRIKKGDQHEPAAAPQVCIVNLSIGDLGRPFYSELSPLARLLDWLAWRHKVLFLVSAGNHQSPLRLTIARTDFLRLSVPEQQQLILKALANEQHLRRLLSPAENVNGLSVGASSDDHSSGEGGPVAHVEPLGSSVLPSPISALGLGYRRSVKPDLLAPGGRCPLEVEDIDEGGSILRPYSGPLAPGVRVASPAPRAGKVDATICTRGTSVACAMATHWATMAYEVIEELRHENQNEIDQVPRALWIKTLLVHASIWSDGYTVLETLLKNETNGRNFRAFGSRFMGYGRLEPDRCQTCSGHRATALGCGLIAADEKRVHRFPLPPSLAGKLTWKRLTVTLSWFTPINPLHQAWRRAELWFETAVAALKVKRNGADYQAARRGTVQHEVYEGEQAAVFVDGDAISFAVNCCAGAGVLEEQIPYTIAVTLEVAEGVEIPIYDEVRVRLRSRIRVGAASSTH